MSETGGETLTAELPIQERVAREVQNLIERDGGLLTGHVPMGLIDDTDVPVNHQNLRLIGVQLTEESVAKGNDGQIQPIMLGMVEGHDLLYIIDGFHRFTKFKDNEQPTIFGTIIAVTMDELLDKRIQNTRNHSGLQFARATQWVRQAWDLNPLSHLITANQAFVLGRTKGSTGSKLGLSVDQVTDVKTWVDAKAMLWGLDPMTIYGYLNTDESVAAGLVRNSRPDRDQAGDALSLNHSTLSRIGRAIGGREQLQLAVAEVILTNKLSGTGITGLLSDVKKMSDDKALEYLATVDVSAYKERIAGKQTIKITEDEVLRLDRVRDKSRVAPLANVADLTTIHVDLAIEEGAFEPDRLQKAAADITAVILGLTGAVERIHQALGEESSRNKSNENEVVIVEGRTIEDFTAELTEFLRDSELDIVIRTSREARAAERALTRGRGTQESLAGLELEIERFHSAHEG